MDIKCIKTIVLKADEVLLVELDVNAGQHQHSQVRKVLNQAFKGHDPARIIIFNKGGAKFGKIKMEDPLEKALED